MKSFLSFVLLAVFAIFVGSQITEGVLLVPYWQSLSTLEFYSYYSKFGPSIAKFYTFLTILAALIPISIAIYCKLKSKEALKNALISSFFAILFIASFYIYFKGANDLFYQATLNDTELKNELLTWSHWHWSRVIIELLSLLFLILSFIKMERQ